MSLHRLLPSRGDGRRVRHGRGRRFGRSRRGPRDPRLRSQACTPPSPRQPMPAALRPHHRRRRGVRREGRRRCPLAAKRRCQHHFRPCTSYQATQTTPAIQLWPPRHHFCARDQLVCTRSGSCRAPTDASMERLMEAPRAPFERRASADSVPAVSTTTTWRVDVPKASSRALGRRVSGGFRVARPHEHLFEPKSAPWRFLGRGQGRRASLVCWVPHLTRAVVPGSTAGPPTRGERGLAVGVFFQPNAL